MERIYIDKYTGRLERTDLYLVKLTLKNGDIYEELEPRMLFPFTNHSMYISLLNKQEKEVAFIRDLAELDEASANALKECFSEYYMIPKILRVLSCEDKFGNLKWTVETDRGEITFQIKNRHNDIKHLWGTPRVIVRDSNDNRYEIPNYKELDSRSARLLFSYL